MAMTELADGKRDENCIIGGKNGQRTRAAVSCTSKCHLVPAVRVMENERTNDGAVQCTTSPATMR